MGITTVNREGDAYKDAVDILEIVMSPILIIFFVLVGSEIRFEMFAPDVFPWFAIVFFVIRAIGKVGGTYIGVDIANGPEIVKRYLGLGMIPQGGLVLGLITVADRIMTEAGHPEIGVTIVLTIIIATLFSETFGSFGAVYGLGKAGELDRELAENNPIAPNEPEIPSE